MPMFSNNKSLIQLLKSLHILAVLKPFNCKRPFYCCTKWDSMQSALGKLLTRYKLFEKSHETVECMPMKQVNVSQCNYRMCVDEIVECISMLIQAEVCV